MVFLRVVRAMCEDGTAHFDDMIMSLDGVAAAVQGKGAAPVVAKATVVNTDRSVGTVLAGNVARIHGDDGIAATPTSDGSTVQQAIKLDLTGSAGQSMGAFLLDGVEIDLKGEANDYVGKGIHGGRIVIKPKDGLQAKEAAGKCASENNVICGNTCLYGATGGSFHARGRAGERFAVRNSGCRAVVEGTGDHCCEYMTNGEFCVLRPATRPLLSRLLFSMH